MYLYIPLPREEQIARISALRDGSGSDGHSSASVPDPAAYSPPRSGRSSRRSIAYRTATSA